MHHPISSDQDITTQRLCGSFEKNRFEEPAAPDLLQAWQHFNSVVDLKDLGSPLSTSMSGGGGITHYSEFGVLTVNSICLCNGLFSKLWCSIWLNLNWSNWAPWSPETSVQRKYAFDFPGWVYSEYNITPPLHAGPHSWWLPLVRRLQLCSSPSRGPTSCKGHTISSLHLCNQFGLKTFPPDFDQFFGKAQQLLLRMPRRLCILDKSIVISNSKQLYANNYYYVWTRGQVFLHII